jgi:hypothetical protein
MYMKHIKYVVMAVSASVVVLLTIAASSQGQGQYKLGGGFIGNNEVLLSETKLNS